MEVEAAGREDDGDDDICAVDRHCGGEAVEDATMGMLADDDDGVDAAVLIAV